ncbi:MAG: hypothetical protein HY721_24825 [Planctomycetes bacterium]|nr:hypothetical protein [Planctomycetota bacterium]
MRRVSALLCGLLGLWVALQGCGAVAPEGDAEVPPALQAEAPAGAGVSAPPAPGASEAAALRERIAELEKALAARAGPQGGPAAPEADAKLLMDLFDKRDPPALMREIERLLLAGDPGHAALYQFFDACDREHQKILALTHEPLYVYGLLRLAALHPGETARLSRHLMAATRATPRSFIRREIYNFLPVFLNHHRGKYPEARREIEEDIVYQLAAGGQHLYKVLSAMRELGYQPPAGAMVQVLFHPETADSHAMAIGNLADRGAEGIQALLRFVREAKDPPEASLVETFSVLARREMDRDEGIVRGFFEDERPEIRRAALLGYFSHARDAGSIPPVLDFLSSDVSLSVKRSFISFLRQKNRHLLVEIANLPDEVPDPRVRDLLQREVTPRPQPVARDAKDTKDPKDAKDAKDAAAQPAPKPQGSGALPPGSP